MKVRKSIIKRLIIILLIILGIGCLTYTSVMCFLTQTNHSYIVNNYTKTVAKLSDDEIEKIESKANDYNKALNNLNSVGDYDKNIIEGNYDVLQVGDVISYLDIPSIDCYLPVYDNTEDNTLQVGLGHQKNTSLPVGGKNTNCVILGHSGLTTDTLFNNLPDVKKGDLFYLNTLNKKYTYKVSNIYTVLPDELDNYIDIKKDRDIVTLITCTPIGVNTHRLVVQGERIEDVSSSSASSSTAVSDSSQTHKSENKYSYDNMKHIILIVIIAICGIIAFSISFLIILKHRRKKEKMSNGKTE